MYKVPYNLRFFPTPIILSFDFLPQNFSHLPSSSLDNLPHSLYIIEQMILLPLTLFSVWYSSKKPLNSLPLFTTWNSSPKDWINSPPPGGNEELYSTLNFSPKKLQEEMSKDKLRRNNFTLTIFSLENCGKTINISLKFVLKNKIFLVP